MSSSYIQAGQILQIHILPVEFRYLFSNIRTFLSNFVATDVYALLLNPCRESFFLAGSLFSFPCLSQNLSGTPALTTTITTSTKADNYGVFCCCIFYQSHNKNYLSLKDTPAQLRMILRTLKFFPKLN